MASELYIGVEGGGSCSKGILLDGEGNELARSQTTGTNHWGIGIPKTVEIILALVDQLLTIAKQEGSSVKSIGLSLSGAETPNCVTSIASALYDLRPQLIVDGKKAKVYNDAIAALETATDQGGIVLITGTGSNCRLLESAGGASHNCGGWGHMIGDEGGAYWISHRTLKTLIDHDDNKRPCSHNLDYVRQNMKSYFSIDANSDMLPHLYSNFSKSFMAGFTVKIAEGAHQADPLCVAMFSDAGIELGKHVVAVCRKSGKKKNEITIVCVGSVWKSWPLLKGAFEETIAQLSDLYDSMKLVRLKSDGAIGAAVAGARDTGYTVPIDYAKHTEPICVISYRME